MDKVYKTFTVKQNDDGWWVASTPSVDRDGDIVEPMGLDLSNWQKAGAPLIWGHDYRSHWSTIGKAAESRLSDSGFELKPEWRDPVNDSDPMTIIKGLIEQGLIRQLSIGFRPLEFEEIDTGLRFTSAEVMEVSAVNVAANQDALRRIAKGLEDESEGLKTVKLTCDFCGEKQDYSHVLAIEFLISKHPVMCQRCTKIVEDILERRDDEEQEQPEANDNPAPPERSAADDEPEGEEPDDSLSEADPDDSTTPDGGQATRPDDEHPVTNPNTEPETDEDDEFWAAVNEYLDEVEGVIQ